MQVKWEYLAAGASSIVVAMFVWFAPPVLHLIGANAWVLRGGILLLGLLCIIGFLVWARSRQPGLPASPQVQNLDPQGGSEKGSDDVDILVREATKKTAAARLAGGAKLSSLPVVFLIGETGAGKTSVMDQSGLDAELLAGQVFQESSIVPTRITNLWFARKTLFVEAGGPLMDDVNSWSRLVKHFVPGRMRSIFNRGGMAQRAAVVCVDCEKLVREGGFDKIVVQSRKLRTRLEQLSHHIGVSLPVYVLLTRSDCIPYFREFTGVLSEAETTQVLGTTLPLMSSTRAGVYAEQETRRLTAALQSMAFSLAECRPGLLQRERDTERQAGIYEFPREFGKVGKPLVQFMVDLCRPAHLRSGPFLRGFYFTGQRPLPLGSRAAESMLAPNPSLQSAPGGFSADATKMMRSPDVAAKSAWPGGTRIEGLVDPRESNQRIFLSHVFSHVVLQDRAALGVSARTTRGDLGRRVLLGTVVGLAAVWIIGSFASFAGNVRLISSAHEAAHDLSLTHTSAGSRLPSLADLQRLETLRGILTQLRDYQQNGVPLHLRWGLYSGDAIFNDTRVNYFNSLDQLVLQHAKQNLYTNLHLFTGDPKANTDSGSAYDALKAYLLMTSEYKRNSGVFLEDFLMAVWKRDLGDLDSERRDLTAKQFNFYSSELTLDNPYSKENETVLIDHVRAFLNKLAGPQRIYLSMLADTRQKTKDYRFAAAHPDASEVMRAPHDVLAPYTYDGWKVMEENIQNSRRFLQGESWVLGSPTNITISAADLQEQLQSLYENDFIKEWRAFLNSTSVLPLGDFRDSAQKLKRISLNSSPLLALFCDVSDNTNVASASVKLAFQAPQQVVAPGCGTQKKYNQPSNDAYMKGLLNLQICAEQIAQAPSDQVSAVKTSCVPVAVQSLLAADQLAQGLPNDPEGHVDVTSRLLLEAPIKYIQARIAQGAGGTESLCTPYRSLQAEYPFNAHSNREATLQEFNNFFQPSTGRFSLFLNEQKNSIVLEGTTFIRAPGSPTAIGNKLLNFVNQMYRVQQAIYPANSPDPRFEYSVTAHLPEAGGFKSEKLIFDGQELTVTASGGSKKFTWPNVAARSATLTLSSQGGDLDLQSTQGLWAVARFFAGYKWQPVGSTYSIQGPLLGPTGQPIASGGKIVDVRFDVDFKGVPLFQVGFLSGYFCPAKMAQ